MNVIQTEQYFNTLTSLFKVLGLTTKVESYQEDNIYYVQFNPFLMVIDANTDIFINPKNTYHNAFVMLGFDVTQPNKSVIAKSFKNGDQAFPFEMVITFDEFVQKLGAACALLSNKVLIQLAMQAKPTEVHTSVTNTPVVSEVDDKKYTVLYLRDYVLNHNIMQIVPKDKGGAVLMYHTDADSGDMWVKFSLCSRDDKFDRVIGKQEAMKCNPIICKGIANAKGNTVYWIDKVIPFVTESVEMRSQFKKVCTLYKKFALCIRNERPYLG